MWGYPFSLTKIYGFTNLSLVKFLTNYKFILINEYFLFTKFLGYYRSANPRSENRDHNVRVKVTANVDSSAHGCRTHTIRP
jgi:hypothetical protein